MSLSGILRPSTQFEQWSNIFVYGIHTNELNVKNINTLTINSTLLFLTNMCLINDTIMTGSISISFTGIGEHNLVLPNIKNAEKNSVLTLVSPDSGETYFFTNISR